MKFFFPSSVGGAENDIDPYFDSSFIGYDSIWIHEEATLRGFVKWYKDNYEF